MSYTRYLKWPCVPRTMRSSFLFKEMTRKFMLALLSSLFYASYTFAMINSENDKLNTRFYAQSPIPQEEELLRSILNHPLLQKHELIQLLNDQNYDGVQSLCHKEATSNKDPELATRYQAAKKIFSNSTDFIQKALPKFLMDMEPYLAAEVRRNDPLSKILNNPLLQNHLLIQLLKNENYDDALLFCIQKAKSKIDPRIVQLFKDARKILFGSTHETIRRKLPPVLTDLTPYLMEDSAQLHSFSQHNPQ